MDYVLHILTLICLFSAIAVSLDLLAGHAGLMSVAHSAFAGLGAYGSALIAERLGVPFVLSVGAGMLVAAVLSALVSLPSLRVRDDYFVIATFSFQMVAFGIFNNWIDLTQGPFGVTGIRKPLILGWEIDSPLELFLFAFILAAFAHVVVAYLTHGPAGRVLHAIRDDEDYAQSAGVNTRKIKILIFAVSCSLAALGGAFYGSYISYIEPRNFSIDESILILLMVALGGAGSLFGPAVGATVLLVVPEILRFTGMPSDIAFNIRQCFYGAMLVLIILYWPKGIMGRVRLGR